MPKSKNRRKKPQKGKQRRSSARAIRAVGQSTETQVKDMLGDLSEELLRFPVGPCYISEGWQEVEELTSVCITRQRPNGNLIAIIFLVDLGCLGVKDVMAKRFTEQRLQHFLSTNPRPWRPCTPELAVKVVTTGVDYAAKLDLPPAPEYALASRILGDIAPEKAQEEVPTGKDGKPFFVPGPYDDAEKIMTHLTDRLGPEGFSFFSPLGSTLGL